MRDVHEKRQPREVQVWADTTIFHPRRRLRVDKARGWRRRPERRIELFDDVVRRIGERVREAVSERSHLRVQGALWSFSAVAVTSDVTLETLGRLSQVLAVAGPYPETDPDDPGPLSRALLPARKTDDGKAYIFVEGGAKMSGILGALDDLSLSVETAGSSSGQSIAGFLSTGSHGPDFDMRPMADYVRALVLVGPDGGARWVERASEPLVIDEATVRAELLPCCVELVRDDDAFDAAVVSLGALGVVAGLVLQVRREYGLWERVERSEEGGPIVTWEGHKEAVRSGAIFTAVHPEGEYRSLELLLNPYPKGGEHYLHIVRRYEHGDFTERSFHRGGTPFLAVALALLSDDPERFQSVTEKILRSGREDSGRAYSSHEIIDYGDKRLERTWSAELCVTTEGGRHVEFIDEVLEAFDQRIAEGKLFAGLFASRFTQPTKAPLGLETGTARTCHVELHISQGLFPTWNEDDPEKEGELFFADFVDIGVKYYRAGHARFHWGQQHGSFDNVRLTDATHPDLARWVAGRQRLLVDNGWPYAFANELVVRAGLLPMPAGFGLDGYLRTPEGKALPRPQRVRLGQSPIVVALPVTATKAPSYFACNAHGAVSFRDAVAKQWIAIDEEIDPDEAPDGAMSAATRSTGRRVLVCRDADHHLRARRETADGWTGWDEVDDDLGSDPVLVTDAHGNLWIFAVRNDGAVHRWKEHGDDWTHAGAFARPGGHDVVDAPAALLIDGSLLVVVRAADGHLHRARESTPAAWTTFGPVVAGRPAVAVDGDAVFVVAPLADGHLFCGRYDTDWAHGQTGESIGATGVLDGTCVSVVARGGKWAVTHTDPQGWVRLDEVDGVTWPDPGVVHETGAVSAPLVHGDRLLVKVAHDIVVSKLV